MIKASKEIQQKRLEICMPCEYVKYLPIVNIANCSACGCPIKTKILLNFAKCPKGKW